MKLSELMNKRIPTLSFEVFPPKTTDGYESVEKATEEIAKLNPDFMSVTYGAGGSTSDFTVSIASDIQNNMGVDTLAHLTCVKASKKNIYDILDKLKANNIENIMALRGDIPAESEFPIPNQYKYAYELIEDIKAQGDFCIGAAC
jgi:methylenetetrahydrofolate reductase (NADPH)